MEGWKRIFLVFKFFMVLVYIALGVVILFFDVLPFPTNNSGRTFFGAILILYGIFRIYAFLKFLNAKRYEE